MRAPSLSRIPTALAALALLAPPAAANDATAELGIGGLQMVYNSAVAVLSEDLYVSPDEIRVAYRFHNITDAPVTVTVAFPLPAIDAANYEDTWIDLPNPDDPNFVDFRVSVNGKRVVPSIYQRVSALGVDRTEAVLAAGLPLNPADYEMGDALAAIDPATIDGLRRLGLLVVEDWGTLPAWRLETSFYWEMTFPAGEDVIVEHSYRPVVGYGFFGEYQFDDEYYLGHYCMDDAFTAAARRLMTDPDFPVLDERRIQYLLTPAANWATPIGTFHLTVDKGDENALVSFCGTGVTKTSPTTFEMTATDFYPTEELYVLIVDEILN
jgi:hypothetical protein